MTREGCEMQICCKGHFRLGTTLSARLASALLSSSRCTIDLCPEPAAKDKLVAPPCQCRKGGRECVGAGNSVHGQSGARRGEFNWQSENAAGMASEGFWCRGVGGRMCFLQGQHVWRLTESGRLASALLSSSSRATSTWPFMEAAKMPVRPACMDG
jgi:hypothetical protein